MSNALTVFDFLRADAYITVNKKLARSIGLNEAIIYGELVSKYLYFKERDRLTDHYFYCTIEDLEESTTLSRRKQDAAIKKLCELNLIRTKLKGVPPKRYFLINHNIKKLFEAQKTDDYSQFVQNVQIDLSETNNLNCSKQTTNNTNVNKTNFKEVISKKVSKDAPTEPSANISSSLTFDDTPKRDNIFKRATEAYGDTYCQEALRIIDEFIDIDYPKFKSKQHPRMNKAQRMAFAVKILDCAGETNVDLDDIENAMYHALQGANCDPTILYATTQQVLGYWLIKQDTVGYENVHMTAYAPVESYY